MVVCKNMEENQSHIISIAILPMTKFDTLSFWISSGRLLYEMLNPHPCIIESAVQYVRPMWIIKQSVVYDALFSECSICYSQIERGGAAVQHDARHPDMCERCFRAVSKCPFCRLSIRKDLSALRASLSTFRQLSPNSREVPFIRIRRRVNDV